MLKRGRETHTVGCSPKIWVIETEEHTEMNTDVQGLGDYQHIISAQQ